MLLTNSKIAYVFITDSCINNRKELFIFFINGNRKINIIIYFPTTAQLITIELFTSQW